MHERHLEARITQIRRKLRDRFPGFSEEEMAYESGKSEEFFFRLQRKLGWSREEVVTLVNDIINEIINEPILEHVNN